MHFHNGLLFWPFYATWPALEQNFTISVSKMQAKSQNQMAVKALCFTKNIFSRRHAQATNNLLSISSTEVMLRSLPFRLTEVIWAATFELKITFGHNKDKIKHFTKNGFIYLIATIFTRCEKKATNLIKEIVLSILHFRCLPNILSCFAMLSFLWE